MNRIVGFLIFIGIFLAIYFGMHLYVFHRLGGLLKIPKGLPFWSMMVLLTLSLPFASFLERSVPNLLTKAYYIVSTTWLGILFFFVMTLLVFEIVNLLLHPPAQIAGWVIIGFVGLVSLISIVNAALLDVNQVTIEIDGLDREYKLVHLTDLHLGTVRERPFLEKVVGITNSLEPEFVVITGDLFDSSRKLDATHFAPLNDINAETFFVTGNHEVIEGLDYVFPILSTTKVKVLRDEITSFDGIQIIGIDFPMEQGRGEGTKLQILDKLTWEKDKPSILLYHSPKGVEPVVRNGIDLFLAGHTHAGQIFPFNLIERPLYKYMKGLYREGDLQIHVSLGTGTWGPYMRLGSRNEITDIRLIPK